MPLLTYSGFTLTPNCDSGYLVTPERPLPGVAFVAVVKRNPDNPRQWLMREWGNHRASWGKYPTMREAAQAGYDERNV